MKNARKYSDPYEAWEAAKAKSPKQVRRRRMCQVLPYCVIKWEGREILYDRNYQPLWERDANGVVTRSTERYRFKWADKHFYTDADVGAAPWENAEVLKRCEDVLREWGIPLEDYQNDVSPIL
jgi:hypothetical protein